MQSHAKDKTIQKIKDMTKKSLYLASIAITLIAIGSCATAIFAANAEPRYDERPEVQAFVAEMANKHGFSSTDLLKVFANTEFRPSVIKAMLPPADANVRSWERYRPRFVNTVRIANGIKFMAQYAEALKRARETYGVPETVIAAIIGVETVYGQDAGNFRVMDALTTLAFDYPRRAEYFRGELEQYLLMTREQNLDQFSVRGSYAGAIGLPQFMPTNIRKLAVDFDGDGKIDLRNNPIDAIGSVAHYLQSFGWQTDNPIAIAISFQEPAPTQWTDSIIPAITLDDIKSLRFTTQRSFDKNLNFALIPLESPNKAAEYWLGFNNFYVITRYNKSAFYAMSVMQLAEALQKE